MTSPLRIGVVGCGDIATQHLRAIAANSDAVLVGTADTDVRAAAAAAGPFGVPAHPDLAALLRTAQPDVVHICTPHHLHAGMAIECLTFGVHVLLEKPLATTVSDGEAVARAVQASTAILGVCFQNRYNTAVRAIRDVLDSGALGSLLGGRAAVTWSRDPAYYQRRPWRGTWAEAGGGVLINQAIHTLDLLQWFLGDVTEIRAHADQLALGQAVEVEDTATMRLSHAGGRHSLFYASNAYVTDAPITLELVAEQGILKLDTDLRIEHADGRLEHVQETRIGTGERAYWGASHQLLVDDFYRHVRARTPFWISADEALKTLQIVVAAYDQSPGLRR